MTATPPGATPSRGRIFLRSLLVAAGAAVAYVIVTIFTGFDPLWTPIGGVAVLAVLTLVFFSFNGGWRAGASDGSAEHR